MTTNLGRILCLLGLLGLCLGQGMVRESLKKRYCRADYVFKFRVVSREKKECFIAPIIIPANTLVTSTQAPDHVTSTAAQTSVSTLEITTAGDTKTLSTTVQWAGLTTKQTVPTTKQTEPTTKQTEPTTKQTVPTTKQTEPTTKQTVPTTKQTELTTKQTELTTKQTELTTKQTEPTTKQTVPTTKQTEPTTKQTVPTTKQTVPTTKQTVPTTKQTVPITKQTEPTTKQTEPTTKQTVPTTEQTVPTMEQTLLTTDTTLQNQAPVRRKRCMMELSYHDIKIAKKHILKGGDKLNRMKRVKKHDKKFYSSTIRVGLNSNKLEKDKTYVFIGRATPGGKVEEQVFMANGNTAIRWKKSIKNKLYKFKC